ncbi:MAG: lipopolysaccharide heptosyltransferase II [Candidatus Omnitrophota bacterium]
MKRILIVTVNWLGDAIMTTPALRALKRAIPDTYVALMGTGRVRDVYAQNPYLDEFIEFDERSTHRRLTAKLSFIAFLRAQKFDTVFLIHRSFTRAFMCLLAGIPRRIGWKRPKTCGIVNYPVTPRACPVHRQDHYLHLFEQAGIPVVDRNPEVFVSSQEHAIAHTLLGAQAIGNTPIVGIHVAANWELKRWPAERFAELADLLAKKHHCTILFTGAEPDAALVSRVTGQMSTQAAMLCGKTSIRQLAALITHMRMFISNDSGPAHLAASLGVPTLVIFGPTSPALTAPRGRSVTVVSGKHDCGLPCYRHDCSDNRCMRAVSVEDVYFRARTILISS